LVGGAYPFARIKPRAVKIIFIAISVNAKATIKKKIILYPFKYIAHDPSESTTSV